jgi:hypothetical protein
MRITANGEQVAYVDPTRLSTHFDFKWVKRYAFIVGQLVGGTVMILAGAAATTQVISGAGTAAVTLRDRHNPWRHRVSSPMRWPMLEPYAVKVACTVLRGGPTSLPDRHRRYEFLDQEGVSP